MLLSRYADTRSPVLSSLSLSLQGDKYFTIHITPQEECSYVSFETNVILKSYNSLIKKLMDIFQPGKFTVTLFANEVCKIVR